MLPLLSKRMLMVDIILLYYLVPSPWVCVVVIVIAVVVIVIVIVVL